MDEKIKQKLDSFFTSYKRQEYKKGEILIRADDDPAGIFYLTKGNVKEYAISRKGDELVVNIFKPFAFFPMSWAMNDTHNSYYFEAMSDTTVFRVPRKDTLTFVKNEPEILYNLLERVYKGTDGMLQRLTYLMAGNANARLISELIIQVRRFGKTNNNTVELLVSEKDLSAQSGMSRETISREIKVLKDKKIVSFSKNKLIILDLAKLEDELTNGI